MLQPMKKVPQDNRSGYVISKAGSGKTEMARYFAECILSDVPAILFVSPVREAKSDITPLIYDNFDEFIAIQPTGKPRKYFITPNEFHAILRDKLATLLPTETDKKLELAKTVRALKNFVYVCDEFDSERYVRDGLSVQDMFLKYNITRVINMSATDNLVALKIKFERRIFKLATVLKEELSLGEAWGLINKETVDRRIQQVSDTTKRKKLEHIFSRITELEKSITEIEKNIEKELQEPSEKLIVTSDIADITVPNSKSVLLMYPDKDYADADELVKKYATNSNAVLYRDAHGKRTAKYGGETITLEEFRKRFDLLSDAQKPPVYSLYTVDSRGGDFDEFSNGNPIGDNESRVRVTIP